jgi:hypothetical protein
MNERKANKLIHLIEDDFINKFGSINGLIYLALRKKNGLYFLELGYKKSVLDSEQINKIKSEIRSYLPISLSNKLKNTFAEYRYIKRSQNITLSDLSLSSDLDFYHKIRSGSNIQNLTRNSDGTLGGILTLKNYRQRFLISNYHVIMREHGKIGDEIIDDKKNKIGKLFWGVFDRKFDAAIAELYDIKCSKGTPYYMFKGIKKPTLKIKNISGYGAASSYQTGELYSANAIVKVRNDWFKRQLLSKNINLNPGDSGSLVVEESNSGKNKVIGLFIGGSNELKVINNLHELFSTKIEAFIDHKKRRMPEINFKKFY